MFEQTILTSGKKSRRFWTTSLGVAGEAVIVGMLVVAPMLWPQALPRVKDWVGVYAPPVPPPPPGPRPKTTAMHVEPRRSTAMLPEFRVPTSMPARAVQIHDEPPEDIGPVGVAGGTGPGTGPGVDGGVLSGILNAARPAPAFHPPEVHATVAPHTDAPKAIKRIRIGTVDPAKLLVSVKPAYPPLAKTAGISGTVEIDAVIGTDGRLAEIHVKKGHPLLIGAAVDAVKQWVYKPTYLNGDPVEVSTTIMVNFILGH